MSHCDCCCCCRIGGHGRPRHSPLLQHGSQCLPSPRGQRQARLLQRPQTGRKLQRAHHSSGPRCSGQGNYREPLRYPDFALIGRDPSRVQRFTWKCGSRLEMAIGLTHPTMIGHSFHHKSKYCCGGNLGPLSYYIVLENSPTAAAEHPHCSSIVGDTRPVVV